jgi:hypothetical protein
MSKGQLFYNDCVESSVSTKGSRGRSNGIICCGVYDEQNTLAKYFNIPAKFRGHARRDFSNIDMVVANIWVCQKLESMVECCNFLTDIADTT